MKATFIEGTRLNGESFWEWDYQDGALLVPRVGDLVRYDIHTYEVRRVMWLDEGRVQVYCDHLEKEADRPEPKQVEGIVGAPTHRQSESELDRMVEKLAEVSGPVVTAMQGLTEALVKFRFPKCQRCHGTGRDECLRCHVCNGRGF